MEVLVKTTADSPILISNAEVLQLLQRKVQQRRHQEEAEEAEAAAAQQQQQSSSASASKKMKQQKLMLVRNKKFQHRDWIEEQVFTYLQSTPCIHLIRNSDDSAARDHQDQDSKKNHYRRTTNGHTTEGEFSKGSTKRIMKTKTTTTTTTTHQLVQDIKCTLMGHPWKKQRMTSSATTTSNTPTATSSPTATTTNGIMTKQEEGGQDDGTPITTTTTTMTMPLSSSTNESHAMVAKRSGFGLTEAESIQLLNFLPREPVEIHLMIEELHTRMSEKRQEELLQFLQSYYRQSDENKHHLPSLTNATATATTTATTKNHNDSSHVDFLNDSTTIMDTEITKEEDMEIVEEDGDDHDKYEEQVEGDDGNDNEEEDDDDDEEEVPQDPMLSGLLPIKEEI